jgi:isoamylase
MEDFQIMCSPAAFTRALLAFACLLFLALPAVATINAYGLGASFDSTQSNVIFRVYSSRATRIEVDLYASPMGSAEVHRFPLSANSSTNIFSTSRPVATLQAAGITGPVYYGYRAWGLFRVVGPRVPAPALYRTWTPRVTASTPTNC